MQATYTYRHNPSATDIVTPLFFATARAVARIALLVLAVLSAIAYGVRIAVMHWRLVGAVAGAVGFVMLCAAMPVIPVALAMIAGYAVATYPRSR